jgi:polyisoprenoid-binding protein YceI
MAVETISGSAILYYKHIKIKSTVPDMRKIIFLFLASITMKCSEAQYQPIDTGSTVQFKIKNFGLGVSGSFTGIEGNIHFDPGKPVDANFDVSIDANSVNTGIDMRDSHLRNDNYLDTKKYPRIRIASTKISGSDKKGTLFFFGNLTMKNKTKTISFPFTAEQVNGGYIFKGAFKINRKDFDIGGTSTISNEMEILLNVFAK